MDLLHAQRSTINSQIPQGNVGGFRTHAQTNVVELPVRLNRPDQLAVAVKTQLVPVKRESPALVGRQPILNPKVAKAAAEKLAPVHTVKIPVNEAERELTQRGQGGTLALVTVTHRVEQEKRKLLQVLDLLVQINSSSVEPQRSVLIKLLQNWMLLYKLDYS